MQHSTYHSALYSLKYWCRKINHQEVPLSITEILTGNISRWTTAKLSSAYNVSRVQIFLNKDIWQAVTSCVQHNYYDGACVGPVCPSRPSIALFRIPLFPSYSLATSATVAEDSNPLFLDSIGQLLHRHVLLVAAALFSQSSKKFMGSSISAFLIPCHSCY